MALAASQVLAATVNIFTLDSDAEFDANAIGFTKYFGQQVSGGENRLRVIDDPFAVLAQTTYNPDGIQDFVFDYTDGPPAQASITVGTGSVGPTDVSGTLPLTGEDPNTLILRAVSVLNGSATLTDLALSVNGDIVDLTGFETLVGDLNAQYLGFVFHDPVMTYSLSGTGDLDAAGGSGFRPAYELKIGRVPVPVPPTAALLLLALPVVAGLRKKTALRP
jgi:hypothetical protein